MSSRLTLGMGLLSFAAAACSSSGASSTSTSGAGTGGAASTSAGTGGAATATSTGTGGGATTTATSSGTGGMAASHACPTTFYGLGVQTIFTNGVATGGDTLCTTHALAWQALGMMAARSDDAAATCVGSDDHGATIACTANFDAWHAMLQ